jgi:Tol biopolymer transport system component
MGEVYRARDTRLARDVAIKVLPPLFALSSDRLARFEREAQVLASLNHPNIAAIYGLESTGSGVALVLELVEGQSLDAIIRPGGLPLDEVLKLAIQMADALAAAHAAGIVHRDFKPGNVVITPGGQAKVLDFGLAKPIGLESTSATMTGLANAGTAEGTVMGTAAYMSPEQAAGRPVDARSDIFSFGSVLFELVTGRRAFEGDTQMSTMASIINEPAKAVSQVNATVPRDIERIISRCHRKDPSKRVQSMADLRVALEELRDDFNAGRLNSGLVPVVPGARRRRIPGLALAGLAAVLAAVGGVLVGRTYFASAPPPAAAAMRLQHITADARLTNDPDVTPNGSLIAYASDRFDATNRDIWVQPATGGDPVRVTTHAADDGSPAFSPDGSRIAFRSERDGGGIYTVPALGGSERLLVADGRSPRYSPDGKWLSYRTGGRGARARIFVMPAGGGAEQELFKDVVIRGEAVWSPDSTRMLVAGTKEKVVSHWTQAIGAPASQKIDGSRGPSDYAEFVRTAELAAWTRDRLIYTARWGSGDGIFSIPFDGSAFTATPQPVHYSTEQFGGVAVDGGGRLYFSSYGTKTTIWSTAVDGQKPAAAPTAVTATSAADAYPSLSADGSRLAFRSTRRADAAAWVRDLRTGLETALPIAELRALAISPDGARVAYVVGTDLLSIETRGGVAKSVCTSCAPYIWSWTPDGRGVIITTPTALELKVVDVATGKSTPVLEVEGATRHYSGNVSPDGRWIVFMSWDTADRTRLVIAPFDPAKPAPKSTWINATDGRHVDEENGWSADGRTLYFVSERDGFRCVYARGFDPAAGRVLGEPVGILHVHGTSRMILSTAASPGRIAVGGGRLVFPVQELQGNIYALAPEDK